MLPFNNIPDKFDLPENWISIQTIDMHTEGEPLRVVISGFPELTGRSILEMRNELKSRYDQFRRFLMFEPRGHADMYGCLMTPPFSADADFGVLFMHNEGYSTMCGHATIAVAKLAVQLGWIPMTAPVTKMRIDAPCGLISAYVNVENDKITGISFDNVPSFVKELDANIEVEGLGQIRYDLAYGGAFYAFVDEKELGIELVPQNAKDLIEAGMAIKKAIIKYNPHSIDHPLEKDLSFLYGTIIVGEPHGTGSHSRNVCIFADGELDRSPTGSGVSARMAIHYARNEIRSDEWITIESILGSTFRTCIKDVVTFGNIEAVIPRIEGTAYITGRHEFLVDPDDPFKNGFLLK